MDASQLPPVNEDYSAAFKYIKLYQLKEIVRQEDDNPVRFLLDILRDDIDNKTYKFLEYISKNKEKFDENLIKGYKVCNHSDFQKEIINYFNDEQLTRNVDFVKIIAYKNTTVSSWNKFVRYSVIKDSDKSIITTNDLVISYVNIVNIFNEAILKNSEEYIFKDVVNYVHPKYGFKGFMVRFQAIHGGKISPPLFIVDHTDAQTLYNYVSMLENLIKDATTASPKVKSQKWKQYFSFKDECLILVNIVDKNDTTKVKYGRSLDYGFSMTSHKSQGSTFDSVFVDVDDIVFDKNGQPYTNVEEVNRRLYVACSRCKNKLYLKYGY